MLEGIVEMEMGSFDLRSVESLRDIKDSRILLRVDYNVAYDDAGKIKDPARIDASQETIKYLLKKGAKVIIMSHLGRPMPDQEGKYDRKFSLEPIVPYLSKLLGKKVAFSPDCIGRMALEATDIMRPSSVLLLQNLRFHPGEKDNDPEFIEQLALLGDIYVNDSFGTAHNEDASTVGLPKYFIASGKPVAAGFLMQHEVRMLERLINPHGYSIAVMGGAKVEDKLKVLQQLVKKYHVCIGGAMANTFLSAKGYAIGESLVEDEFIGTAAMLMGHYSVRIPVDVVAAKVSRKEYLAGGKLKPEHYSGVRVIDFKKGEIVGDDEMILDIGPETVEIYGQELRKADTIVWNGPMGVFEAKDFSNGTNGIAKKVAEAPHAMKVAGGGESLAAINKSGYSHDIKLSTGGGAMLSFIEKEGRLPGLLPLLK